MIERRQENDTTVRFLYTTKLGRLMLQGIQKSHLDAVAARFLCTPASRPLIGWYAKRYHIELTQKQKQSFHTYRSFFIRQRENFAIDHEPSHLISPCDGWLSAFPIQKGGSFAIKGSRYRLSDLLQDAEVSTGCYEGGICLILRLCASDYHHYCYLDDGYQGQNHFIPGVLHSVQPIACETYPVYTLNRRVWTILATENFGPVVQTEIGALIVGGIYNERENARICRGTEMGHFELAGSTIALFFRKGRIRLLPQIEQALQTQSEYRVRLGMWIGTGLK